MKYNRKQQQIHAANLKFSKEYRYCITNALIEAQLTDSYKTPKELINTWTSEIKISQNVTNIIESQTKTFIRQASNNPKFLELLITKITEYLACYYIRLDENKNELDVKAQLKNMFFHNFNYIIFLNGKQQNKTVTSKINYSKKPRKEILFLDNTFNNAGKLITKKHGCISR